jgi:DNA-binding NarL/FixJ family response regulator
MEKRKLKVEVEPIRVVIIDEQGLFRAGVKSLMNECRGIEVIGEAGSKTEAVDLVEREQPDIILLDIKMNGESGLDFIPDLTSASENSRILILTSESEEDLQKQAIYLGAVGLVSKEKSPDILIKAVKRVHAGEVWLDRTMTASVLGEMARGGPLKEADPEEARIGSLTGREREVIASVGEGLTNKQIAESLFISDVTVRHHLTSIYAKLDVANRLELIIYAYRYGLAAIPQ